MKKEDVKVYQDDILRDLAALVAIPSVQGDDELPFGSQPKRALHKALEIGESYGFRTGNVDDYCGYIEMGQGDQIIGVVAHLDVVPVSKSWKTDPFTLTEIDGKYYGRGTSDDKGAVVASLTAMRMLKELEPTMKKRVRLIMGTNEETGSACVRHYVEKLGPVDCGFTPDGNFPLVFSEKGMIGAAFTGKSDKILSIVAGNAFNIVPNKCELTVAEGCLNPEKLDQFFKENQITYTLEGNKLTVFGIASHASLPEKGVNALSYAMEGLWQADVHDPFIDAYHQFIRLDYNGNYAGVGVKDEYGIMTMNLSVVWKEGDTVMASVDMRVPATFDPKEVAKTLKETCGENIVVRNTVPSLFFPLDHPMIKALMKAYVDVTGDVETKPWAIGGGTYAKEMPNIVAFGCDDLQNDYHIHDDGEFVTMDSLLMQTACYYEAIKNLQEI